MLCYWSYSYLSGADSSLNDINGTVRSTYSLSSVSRDESLAQICCWNSFSTLSCRYSFSRSCFIPTSSMIFLRTDFDHTIIFCCSRGTSLLSTNFLKAGRSLPPISLTQSSASCLCLLTAFSPISSLILPSEISKVKFPLWCWSLISPTICSRLFLFW